MQTVLKTFRLPAQYAEFLKVNATQKKVSQTDVIVESLRRLMELENQWKKDLGLLAQDKQCQQEQIDLAEEHYE